MLIDYESYSYKNIADVAIIAQIFQYPLHLSCQLVINSPILR
jgi:hypothetical protein